jgi:hypothetical protein
MVRDTSKKSHEINKSSGIQGNQKKMLYELVKNITNGSRSDGVTLKELSRESGLEINAVSGRINDLKKEGMIAECDKRKCKITNRTVIPVTIAIGDVGGPSHANIKDGNMQEGLDLGIDDKPEYRYPD